MVKAENRESTDLELRGVSFFLHSSPNSQRVGNKIFARLRYLIKRAGLGTCVEAFLPLLEVGVWESCDRATWILVLILTSSFYPPQYPHHHHSQSSRLPWWERERGAVVFSAFRSLSSLLEDIILRLQVLGCGRDVHPLPLGKKTHYIVFDYSANGSSHTNSPHRDPHIVRLPAPLCLPRGRLAPRKMGWKPRSRRSAAI